MTYKSIRAAIKRHVRAKRLFALEMGDVSDPVKRILVYSESVRGLLEGPWVHYSCAPRVGRLRADLEAFVRGDPISICLEPYVAGDAFLGRLAEPTDEVWDMRAREPNPALRLFGRFAAPDHFVAFDWRPRSKPWNGREALTDRHDPGWETVKTDCKRQWETLFPKHEPFHDLENANEYITENGHSFRD